MINLGIISGDNTGSQTTKFLQTTNDLKVIGVSAGHNELTEKMLSSQSEAIIDASDTIYFDQLAPSFAMVKQAIRKRKNLFLSSFPNFADSELRQLINLSHEAGSTTQIFVPEIFHVENYQKQEQVKSPFLANIRIRPQSDAEGEQRLFRIILLLVQISNSEFRKTDLMTIPNPDGTNLLECRIVFTSGSVARILFSDQIKTQDSGIEFFQSGQDLIRFESNDFSDMQVFEAQKIAVDQFVSAIHSQKSVVINFSHFLQAQRIFMNLRAKMSYSGGFSSPERYAV